MCGIAGFFGKHVAEPAVAQAMKEEIRRRGPDAQHIVSWDAALRRCDSGFSNALISARLAIIDPRPLADQPMSNEAGDIWICYNGEVFDWAGHADILRSQGAQFRTHSDTEFILRAYEAWGMDCLSRLRGMFAFAILDLRKQQVFLVRDGMGIKPLAYSLVEGELAFSSTVRGVLP
jgi:asparagine synthase (glutamine-hydrolysing)